MGRRVEIHIVGFAKSFKNAVAQSIGGMNKISAAARKHEAQLRSMRMKSGIALGAQVMLVRQLVKAYETQEQSEAKLAQAMKNRGIYTEEAFEETKKFASEMQRLTKFGDEEIMMAQNLNISVGKLSGEGLKRATAATLDLAEAKGMKLTAAADLVSKSIGSTTNALSRYGIQIREGVTDPTERAELIVREISKTFGGQAAAAADTYSGKLKQLSNSFGDLQEDLGKAIIPLIVKLANILHRNLPAIRNWVKAHQNLIAVIAGGGIGGAGLLFALSQLALAFTHPATGIIALIAMAAAVIGTFVAKSKMMNAVLKETARNAGMYSDKVAELDAKISLLNKKRAELEKRMGAKSALFPGKTAGEVSARMREELAEIVYQIGELENQKQKLRAFREEYLALRKEMGKGGEAEAGEGLPTAGEVEGPSPESLIGMVMMEPEDLDEQEELMDQHIDQIAEYNLALEDEDARHKQKLIDMFGAYTKDSEQLWQDHVKASEQWASKMGWGIYRITDKAFSTIFQRHRMFFDSLTIVTAQALVNIFDMLIDAAVHELIAEKVKTVAQLMIRGAIDWSALGKIAAVTAIAGAAKSALQGMSSGIAADIGKRYKYGGILPRTGLFYGEEGERVWNPAEPVESALNAGAGLSVHWHQEGPIRDEEEAENAIKEFGENLLYGQLGRRMAT